MPVQRNPSLIHHESRYGQMPFHKRILVAPQGLCHSERSEESSVRSFEAYGTLDRPV
jgi:hypothetical protein